MERVVHPSHGAELLRFFQLDPRPRYIARSRTYRSTSVQRDSRLLPGLWKAPIEKLIRWQVRAAMFRVWTRMA